MNFFSGQNRVKTPTFPQQSQLPSNPARSSARPRNAPQSARPKLTQRISSFPATRNTSQTQKSPVDGSDTPFAFMPEEYSEFYVGVVDPMVIVTILQEKLMNNLYDPLPPTDNGSLCQIFESYRSLITENETLRAQRDEGIQRRQLAESSLAEGKQQWAEEEKAYKVEIKKLETLVAHSNHGIEGVVKARRDSVVRKKKRESLELVRESKEDGRETVYEFLASYRMDDKSASRKAVGTYQLNIRRQAANTPSSFRIRWSGAAYEESPEEVLNYKPH